MEAPARGRSAKSGFISGAGEKRSVSALAIVLIERTTVSGGCEPAGALEVSPPGVASH